MTIPYTAKVCIACSWHSSGTFRSLCHHPAVKEYYNPVTGAAVPCARARSHAGHCWKGAFFESKHAQPFNPHPDELACSDCGKVGTVYFELVSGKFKSVCCHATLKPQS